MTLTAQTMQQLTEQLGKTVLYGDVALSPDGKNVAWVQSTAASTSKQTYVRETSGNAPAILIKIPISGERTDFDPAWAPDSKTLAIFCSAGEGEQRQLWIVKANGSDPKKITNLKGYAARPRWSHDGKQIAFLYIEGAGGGGPLMAAPRTTGVIDTAIHNQRIAVLEFASGKLRQVSPAEIHVYDYDWSPDDKMFVATAAPGPGDNNWWIAEIWTMSSAGGDRASLAYKPSLQVCVPRWSPDGNSIAFIEGLMSDEGFHGGDLLVIPPAGGEANRTANRKGSVSSLFWLTPDRILFTEYVGGGSAISELNLSDNSTRTLWKGPEGIHAFGNFPDFSISKAGNIAAAELSTYNSPPEIFAGPPGEWRQLTNNNVTLRANWGKAESVEWTNEGFNIQGWLVPPAKIEAGKKYPMVVLIHGGPSSADNVGVAGIVWNVACDRCRAFHTWLLRSPSQSAWKLRPGRRFHTRKRARFRARRSTRQSRGNRCGAKKISDRPQSSRCDGLELWRLHDHVDRHANRPLPRRCRGRRHRELAKLLWPEPDRPMDDPVLRRVSLR